MKIYGENNKYILIGSILGTGLYLKKGIGFCVDKIQKELRKIDFKDKREHRKEIYKERKRMWHKKQRQSSKVRLDNSMSGSIYRSLKGNKAGRHWENLVDYTLQDLIKHLESLFEAWMNWDNYGRWHVDHIKPKSLFHYNTARDKEFKECWGLSNLQPLLAKENLVKNNKYEC